MAQLPPALSQYNGDIFQITKSKLPVALKENIITNRCPTNISEEIKIVVEFQLLTTMVTIPHRYGKILEYILRKISNPSAKGIH